MRRRALAGVATIAVVAIAVVALAGNGSGGAGGTGAAASAPLPPVAPTISADPSVGPARATMIMIHGGGWAGHSAAGQRVLLNVPGAVLRSRGWRTVSVDYDEGAAGLQDLLDAVNAEVLRRTSDGPLCIYGESSGAHLALVAASRLRAVVDCVVGVGTPTDLVDYGSNDAANPQVRLLTTRIHRFFGTTPDELAAWDPLSLAGAIDADVLLLRQADDYLIAPQDGVRFKAVHAGTQVVSLQAGDPHDPADAYLHGTVSAAGRRHYAAAIAAFADHAVAAASPARRAARAQAAAGAGVDESFDTPATLVHSIAISADHMRALAGSIAPPIA